MENASPCRPARLLGLLMVLGGLLLNASSIGYYLAEDFTIDSSGLRMAILASQVVLVLAGIVLLVGRNLPSFPAVRGVVATALCVGIGFGFYGTARTKTDIFTPEIERIQGRELDRMLTSESVHLKLTPRFKKLGTAAKNLRLPSVGVESVFADEVLVADIGHVDDHHEAHELPTVGVFQKHYTITSPARQTREQLDLMRPLIDEVDRFEHIKFGFVQGDFEGDDFGAWRVQGYSKGLAHMKNGERVQFKGKVEVLWRMDEGSNPRDKEHLNDPTRWRIHEMLFKDFHSEHAVKDLFTEELANVVRDPDALREAKRNITREMLFEWLTAVARKEKWRPKDKFWDYRAAWALPTVVVVDINNDGLDDFYKVAQYGKNQLFQNNGDGTFDEIAGDIGLDVENHTNTAIFADFDNDGDADCFLGRSLEPSKYLINEDGHFVDRTSDLFGGEGIYWVTSASAADYDGDGQLDLYVGTYAAQIIVREMNKRYGNAKTKPKTGAVLTDYLPRRQAEKLFALAVHSMENHIRDRIGPPNVLLKNAGNGRLVRADDAGLELYRNTFQSTWADYDGDGDVDLYVANDFAYNNLYRNDGGQFVDVSVETGSQDVGFGMGCSWGDVDRDGDQDLYVSNMYSKAGNRIIGSITGADPRFLDMAAGNSLLAWNGSTFDKISSKDDSGKKVEVGGWSWGSQYLDFDNDGWLDLYTLNGYYSAPKLYRDDVDL